MACFVVKEMPMDEEYEIGRSPNQNYPVNRAQVRFLMILWLVPTVFFTASYIGMFKLVAFLRPANPWVLTLVWLLLNVAFVVGTAWFQVMLSHRSQAKGIGKAYHVLVYSVVQIFLVPALLLFLLMIGFLLSALLAAR
jgi:hypothetical protein